MDAESLHSANRDAWETAAVAYEKDTERMIEFLRNGGQSFCPPEFEYLKNLDEWCTRAIHLQCAGGTDTLSLWNLGAHEVIGIDISPRMIECGRTKSEALNAPAKWYACDVLETPHELDGTADLVYTGRGALCWIHDIDAWAKVVRRLLKPGGKLYIYEGHPITWIWDEDSAQLGLSPKYGNYFQTEIDENQGWPETYLSPKDLDYAEQPTKYEVHRNVGQIVNPLLDAGLRLLRIEEHPHEYYDSLPNLPQETKCRLPNTISLLFEKSAD